ncbi:MAG TPA: adenylate/guanylate cyclase domain-containing protein [Candidatus Binatia bacterium]|jgi:class 3 adenylate cyclase|nr:adenylate/guanylate cyclase domain-containing protein [Candidatus Binatia bacterium]
MEQSAVSLTIVFADISGSTRLYEMLGDVRARERTSQCLSVLTEVIKRHGGTVVKTIGDEVMSTFPSADAAVQAACAMQESVAAQVVPGETALDIRVGLQHGSALVELGDVFGDAVNVAARMVALAKARQILTTRQTVEKLSPLLRAGTRHTDRVPVKGKQEEIDVYEVIWREEDLTRMEGSQIPLADSQARLQLRFREKEIEVSHSRPVVTIGRGQQNDIIVLDALASRMHARIEYRRGKFVLLDQSTNGTYVLTDEGEKAYLRREELVLRGSGVISLGRAAGTEAPEIIHFVCQL